MNKKLKIYADFKYHDNKQFENSPNMYEVLHIKKNILRDYTRPQTTVMARIGYQMTEDAEWRGVGVGM